MRRLRNFKFDEHSLQAYSNILVMSLKLDLNTFYLKEKEPGTRTLRNFAQIAVENVTQWWLRQAGFPTKSDYILTHMSLNIHKEWTILFKQRSKTIQQQLDKSKLFFI